MEQRDYYQVLGVSDDSDAVHIRDAYRRLAFKYHPDRNKGDERSADKMKWINEAYAVLSNPEKRHDYDAIRNQFGDSAHTQFRNAYSEQDIFRDSDIYRIFEEMTRSFGLRGSDEIFKEFYGPGYRSFEFRRPGIYSRGFVFTGSAGRPRSQLSLHRALGKVARVLFKRLGGVDLPADGRDMSDLILLTPEQARRGGPYAYYFRPKSKKLIVKIPPGVRSGQKIRLAGIGHDGSGGGAPGDLYLEVSIRRPVLIQLKKAIAGLFKKRPDR